MRMTRHLLLACTSAVLTLACRLAAADEEPTPAPAPAPAPATTEPVAPVIVSEGARAAAETQCSPGWESNVFARARNSVVRISNDGGWGAGFAWKSPRRLVTAMHVVEGARSFDILFGDGSKGRAHLVAGSRTSDLAILELDGTAPFLTPLELGEPRTLPLGAPVIAIGHPLARSRGTDAREEGLRTWTITRGVLGARNDHQIQVDAPLNPGNSGGPILDCTGNVIGVASHVAGSLGFASGPSEILDLERHPTIPGVSFAPTSVRLRIGLSARASDFTAYGPFADLSVGFFSSPLLMVRATGLLDVHTSVAGERAVTSRSGAHLFAGAGWGMAVWRLRVVPHAGVSWMFTHENALTFANGRPTDTSRDRSSVRMTPGLAVTNGPLMLDYKAELDVGQLGDTAHIFSASIAFF